MKTLLKILNAIFVFLGVVFFILLLLMAYLWFADPFKLKPLIFPAPAPASSAPATPRSSSGSFTLTAEQLASLKNLGIDTSKLPSTISPALESCFASKLGVARTEAIKQGSLISAIDLYQVQSCLK